MHSVYCNSLLAAFFSCKTESNETQITLLKKKILFVCLTIWDPNASLGRVKTDFSMHLILAMCF